MHVIVGLGNPGPRYAGTRHNAGFLVVDELARRHGAGLRREGRGDATRDEARLRWQVSPPPGDAAGPEARDREASRADLRGPETVDVLLVKPLSFMNLSGAPLHAVMSRGRVSPGELLVVHDDMDLPLGRLRFKQGGGAGGQRGVRDIADRIGPDFLRLKVGVSRPPAGWQPENWVLSRFAEQEKAVLGEVIAAAADAVEALLDRGLEAAMNRTNGLDLAAGVPKSD